MPRLRFPVWAASALLALVHLSAAPEITWTMLNVTPLEGQADCHLLRLPDGSDVLIDPADAWDAPGTAVKLLQRLGVTHLRAVVISHFHHDHYRRMIDILDAGIKVDRVILNVPDKESADREIPWGCDYQDVQRVLSELHRRQIPTSTPLASEIIWSMRLEDGSYASIKVLAAYDGKNTPIGATDVNDTSIVLRVRIGNIRALFTGDLNHALGEYLARSGMDLQANILKAPHHGTEGTVPDEFYDRVNASTVLVPSPKALWESARSKRTRSYYQERKIPTFVSGIDGNVTVRMRPDGYTVEKEL